MYIIVSCSFLLVKKNVSNKSRRENENTHFMFNNFFFRKSSRLCYKAEEYIRAGQATNNNVAHAQCMLDT